MTVSDWALACFAAAGTSGAGFALAFLAELFGGGVDVVDGVDFVDGVGAAGCCGAVCACAGFCGAAGGLA